MKSIQVQNFRSISDSKLIKLKPLNFLLGANSSGKSSFLRIFPLIKQSFEVSTSAPLLWYGRLVDFGTASNSKNRNTPMDPIIFKFGFDIDFEKYMRTYGYYFRARPSKAQSAAVDIQIGLEENELGKSFLSFFEFNVYGTKVKLKFTEDGKISSYIIDNIAINELIDADFFINNSSIIPEIIMHYRIDEQGKSDPQKYSNPIQELMIQSARSFVHANTGIERIREAFNYLDLGSTEHIVESFCRGFGWSKAKRESLQKNTIKFQKFKSLFFAYRMPIILNAMRNYFEDYFSNNFYIGPSRAIAKRYYRQQDLAINEVDYQGENLAMYLRSLQQLELEALNTFCQNYFDFKINVNSEAGHTSVVISERNGPYLNLVDLGFGYSQLLPVIVQVWHALNKQQPGMKNKYLNSFKMLTIEQPELHLHPKFQGHLADLFMGSIKDSKKQNKDFKLIIETHSEAIINGIGHLINKGALNHEDVQILIFQPNPSGEGTSIETVIYSESGHLINWPYGFFSHYSDEASEC